MIEVISIVVTVALAIGAGYMRLSKRVTVLETKVSERNIENEKAHERIENGVTHISGQFDALKDDMHDTHIELLEAIKANGK
jgi:hypothetical protein